MSANRNVGEVEITIGERTLILRYGNRELARLEKLWNVAGISAIYTEALQTSHVRFIEFSRVGLSRHQATLTDEDVADLLDYRDAEDERPLVHAVTSAFEMAIPKVKTSPAGTGATETETSVP